MKKILASVLALSFVLALAGCSTKGQTQDVKQPESAKQPSVSIALSSNIPVSAEPSKKSFVAYETTVSWVNYSAVHVGVEHQQNDG